MLKPRQAQRYEPDSSKAVDTAQAEQYSWHLQPYKHGTRCGIPEHTRVDTRYAVPGCIWYTEGYKHDTQCSTPRTDDLYDLYDLFPLHDLDLSMQFYSRSCKT